MRKQQYQLVYVRNRYFDQLEFDRANSRTFESFSISEKKLLQVIFENLFDEESEPVVLNGYLQQAWDTGKNQHCPEIEEPEFDRLVQYRRQFWENQAGFEIFFTFFISTNVKV